MIRAVPLPDLDFRLRQGQQVAHKGRRPVVTVYVGLSYGLACRGDLALR